MKINQYLTRSLIAVYLATVCNPSYSYAQVPKTIPIPNKNVLESRLNEEFVPHIASPFYKTWQFWTLAAAGAAGGVVMAPEVLLAFQKFLLSADPTSHKPTNSSDERDDEQGGGANPLSIKGRGYAKDSGYRTKPINNNVNNKNINYQIGFKYTFRFNPPF